MAGFLLLPIAGQIRDGALSNWPARDLAVLVALAAHENGEIRLAWPSQTVLARLAAVRKADVRGILADLARLRWIARAPGSLPRWRMGWSAYPGDLPPRDWLRIDRALVFQGVWAAMAPGTRALYLVMKALSWRGQKAEVGWMPEPGEAQDAAAWEPVGFQFLPAAHLDPGELARLSGLTMRTSRRARAWLLENRLVIPTKPDQKPGLILPFDPHLVAPSVLEALERDKVEARLPKGAALRAYRAAQKAARKNEINSATSKRTVTREPRTVTREPTNGHQGADERSSGTGNEFLTILEREINELNDPSAPWEGADATATG